MVHLDSVYVKCQSQGHKSNHFKVVDDFYEVCIKLDVLGMMIFIPVFKITYNKILPLQKCVLVHSIHQELRILHYGKLSVTASLKRNCLMTSYE